MIAGVMERLELVDTADFETELTSVLHEFSDFVGISAIGEVTRAVDSGVLWFDAERTTLEELATCIEMFDDLPEVDAMSTLRGPSGRPASIIPNPPGSHANYMALLATEESGLSGDAASLCVLLSAAVSSARRRVVSTRALDHRLEVQAFLNSISSLASVREDDPETLFEILALTRSFFGLGAVSYWEADGATYALKASASEDGRSLVDENITVDVDLDASRSLLENEHMLVPLGFFSSRGEDFLFPTDSEALVVPISSPTGAEGAVVFTDPRRRVWDDLGLHAAHSIARSVQEVVSRARLETNARIRREFDATVRRIATAAARMRHDSETAFLGEVTSAMIDLLGLTGASVWRRSGISYERVFGMHADKTPELERATVEGTAAWVTGFHERGHGFIDRAWLHSDSEIYIGPGKALIIPIGVGTEYSGLISFVDAERGRWSEAEIHDAEAIGSVVTQTLGRFAAERAVERRLELEGLSGEIAKLAVEARVDFDPILEAILSRIAEFFGLLEVQAWQFENGRATLRMAHRPDGNDDHAGVDVPYDPTDIAVKGWGIIHLENLERNHELLDPPDTKVLLMPYRRARDLLGMLALIDPRNRHWSEDEISYIQTLSGTIAQLQIRMHMYQELEYQRQAQEILTEATAAYVDSSLEDVHEIVLASLERVRSFLDCESLAVFEVDHRTRQITCENEATRDGKPLQSTFAPFDKDSPIITRTLDPTEGPDWSFGELFRTEPTDLNVHVQSVANDRAIVVLSAVTGRAAPVDDESARMLSSLVATLGQLCSRLMLEDIARRRAESDRVLREIAGDFVDRAVEDADQGIHEALRKVGELFGRRSVGIWDLDSELGATRRIGWVVRAADDSGSRHRHVPADHPTLAVIADIETTRTFESPVPDWEQLDTATTLTVAPIRVGGEVVAFVSSEIDSEMDPVTDPDIHEDALGSLALLVRQLWNRLDADRAMGRQLAMEDMLRRFATRLVSTPAEELGGDERALSWLAKQLGMEHLSAWAAQVSDDTLRVGLLVEGATSEWSLPEEVKGFTLAIADEPEIRPDRQTDSWPIDDAPYAIGELMRSMNSRTDRRIGFIRGGQSDSDRNYLLASRVGLAPFADYEFSILTAALTIITQHHARVSAERSLTAAFTAAPIAISLREADTTFIACNAAYEALTGRTADDLAGTKLDLVVSPDQVEGVLSELDRILPFGRFEQESAFRRPDGTILWADVRSTPVQIPGRRDPVLLTYAEDITERRRDRQLLEYQASHDELTGLPNRRAFVAQVSTELARSNECAVLVLDLDRFKVVNDSLGHSVGDQLLITCSDRIRLSLRPGDAVCRLGGDEFAILLRAPADPRAASVVADRLLRLLREPVRVGGEEVFPSASVGIAIPEEGDVVEDLLRYADAAMYQAKGHGRDQWVRFDRSMREAVVERIRTETDLRRAIDNGQLEVHYQPEFLLDTGGIVGVEALVRWRHPERGLLAAGTFISLAEETGLVVDLGRWVLGQATAQGAKWIDDGHDIITRVNLSARQLRAAVVGEVQEALSAANLPASRLCLELTETTIMDDVQESARILQQFRDMGVQIAIDDFGTGFSSLAYLKRFPVDILKIDRAFVDGVGVDPDDTAIVHSIIGLAQTLRLDVVAEGIEDETQIAELVSLGCRRGQGFHLARPAPADDVGLLLRADKRVE